MERSANYALVGALSVILLLGSLVFIVWFAQFSFNQTFDDYRIIFRGPVSGLSKGGEVQFNGIRVGEITRIELDQRDPNKVITDIRVQNGTPVRVDSQARLQSQGITGVRFVLVSAGTPTRPLLRDASRARPPVIAAAPGRLDALVQDVSSMMRDGAQALERINRVLSDRNLATISQSLDDVGAVTAELRERRTLFARLDGAAQQIELAAGAARTTLGGQGRGTLGEISTAASELRSSIADMRQLITRADGSMVQLSATTLPELNATLGQIQATAFELENLTADIRQDPRATLTRAPGREVEVPR
jgi:phospholipid/cholesterol/gamma-HCH transport system substrate-binding protein